MFTCYSLVPVLAPRVCFISLLSVLPLQASHSELSGAELSNQGTHPNASRVNSFQIKGLDKLENWAAHRKMKSSADKCIAPPQGKEKPNCSHKEKRQQPCREGSRVLTDHGST